MRQGLHARELTVRLGGRTVVDRVSLDVAPGEVVGLLGPNGAGKTTIFRLIMGMIRCQQGSLRLGERDLGPLPTHRRARLGLGYLSQEPSVLTGLSVRDNVKLVLELGRQTTDSVDTILASMGLSARRSQRARTLSGGERRRLELACLLAGDYSIVLLDEPFKGLDPVVVAELSGRLLELAARGIGLLVTDHAVRQTLSICSRAYILEDGRIVAEGRAEEIQDQPRARTAFFGGAPSGLDNQAGV